MSSLQSLMARSRRRSARSDDYVGVDLEQAQRVGALLGVVGILVAVPFILLVPPTERIGALGSGVVALALDVREPESCERFVGQAVEALGGIDILVNAAGLALGREPFEASTEEDERTVFETNVNGLVRITRLCLPHIRDGGHIVNLGSIAGRQAYPNGSSYITSKFAVRGFT